MKSYKFLINGDEILLSDLMLLIGWEEYVEYLAELLINGRIEIESVISEDGFDIIEIVEAEERNR